MTRAAERASVLLLLVLFLGGCGSARPLAPSPSSSVVGPPDRFGAPVVERPVDVAAVANNPCSLLSSDELQTLDFRQPGRQRTSIDVPECRWTTSDQQSLSVAVDANRDLLADTYRTRNAPVFVPVEIEGFPAVRQKSSTGEPNICTVTTGLGPRQALETTWIGRGSPLPGSDACELAEQAIRLAVRKLPPAS